MEGVVGLFPKDEQDFWGNVLAGDKVPTEIRFRVNKPLFVYYMGKEAMVDELGHITDDMLNCKYCTAQEIRHLLLHFSRYSLYAYETEFRQGFMTLQGGHRLGVMGQAVMENGKVLTMKNISFMNFRIVNQIKGAADSIIPFLYNRERIYNTLLVSPPGCGKTTILRDLIRQVSNGNSYGKPRKVGVVDERCELAGSNQGIPQNDLGNRTDVIEGCSKAEGMRLMIRSMAPEILAIDELGDRDDYEALQEAERCGVGLLATLHGCKKEDVDGRNLQDIFQRIFILHRDAGKPRIVSRWEGDWIENLGGMPDYAGKPGAFL